MNARQIGYMCDSIEAVFAERKVTARITGGTVVVEFELEMSRVPGGLSLVARDICHRLQATRCRISQRDGGGWLVTVE